MQTDIHASFSDLDEALQGKLADCERLLGELRRVVIAFSAGVDSTCLLALALRSLGSQNVLATVGLSPSLPQRELSEAHELISLLDAKSEFVTTEEMADPRFAANPANRCYFCKSDLFERLKTIADDGGYLAVLSGANADDTGDFRPGLQAGKELGVRNPLLEAGLTKLEIRAVSKTMGLPTWDKPSYACLASRVPYGQALSPEKLGRIEKAEDLLRQLGFRQCRVRDHEQIARIEVEADQIAEVLTHRQRIVEALLELGYAYVTVDLKGFRSGSMNETLTQQPKAAKS